MRAAVLSFFAISLLSVSVAADDGQPPGGPPTWFLEEIKILTSGTGRWTTDNSNYQSDDEPYDQYGTEWSASFDGKTMTGRLFGIIDGKDSGSFWEFRQYWHPQKKIAVLEQFGWGGVVGLGTAWQEDNTTKSEQSFYGVDGSETITGHVSAFPDERTHVTESFDIVQSVWKPRRKYTWHLFEEKLSN